MYRARDTRPDRDVALKVIQGVAAGADGLAHVFVDELPDEALCREAADRGVFLIATLTTTQGVYEGPSGAELASDERFVPYLHPTALENLRQPSSMAGQWLSSFDIALEAVRRFHEAGVMVLAGTDVTNSGTAASASTIADGSLPGVGPTCCWCATTRQPTFSQRGKSWR